MGLRLKGWAKLTRISGHPSKFLISPLFLMSPVSDLFSFQKSLLSVPFQREAMAPNLAFLPPADPTVCFMVRICLLNIVSKETVTWKSLSSLLSWFPILGTVFSQKSDLFIYIKNNEAFCSLLWSDKHFVRDLNFKDSPVLIVLILHQPESFFPWLWWESNQPQNQLKDADRQVCIYCWLFVSVAYEKSILELQYWGARHWVRDSVTCAMSMTSTVTYRRRRHTQYQCLKSWNLIWYLCRRTET